MLTTQDIKKLDLKDLEKELSTSNRKLFKVRLDITSGQEKQNHLIKKYKRYIARINTFITNKK